MGSTFSRPEVAETVAKALQATADPRLINLLTLDDDALAARIKTDARMRERLATRTALSQVAARRGESERGEVTADAVRRAIAPSTTGLYRDGGEVRFRVMIRGEVPESGPREGPRVLARAGDIALVDANRSQLLGLAVNPAVDRIELVRPLHPAVDTMLEDIGLMKPVGALPAAGQATGKNVIIGIVDFGLDFYHSQLRDEHGASRVLGLLDLTTGKAYTKQDLDADIASGKPYSVVPHRWDTQAGASADEGGAIWMRHGTHMACIAAGSASGLLGRPGIAPDAELLFVSLDPLVDIAGRGDLWGAAGFDQVVHGIDWIQRRAREIAAERGLADIPVVINLSLADYTGPHDGTSLHAAFPDELRNSPGRVVVAAAGNARGTGGHTHITGAMPASLVFERMCDADDAFEVWVEADDQAELQTTIRLDGQQEVLSQRGVGLSRVDLVDMNGKVLLQVACAARRQGRSLGFRVDIWLGDGVVIPAGTTWEVALHGSHGARAHAWLEASNAGLRGWKSPADDTTVSDLASHPAILTMGAVNSGNEFAAPVAFGNSGLGPTRDGRLKPDLAAPGVAIDVAEPEIRPVVGPELGREHTIGFAAGTSVASAVTAGACAVLMECRGAPGEPALLSARDVRTILTETASKAAVAASPRPVVGDLEAKLDVGAGVINLKQACQGVSARQDLWLKTHRRDDGRVPCGALVSWDSPDIQAQWDDTGATVQVTVRNRGEVAVPRAWVRLCWSRSVSWLHVPGFSPVRGFLPGIFDRIVDALDNRRVESPHWSLDGIRGDEEVDGLVPVGPIPPRGSKTVQFRFTPPRPGLGADDVLWLALAQSSRERVPFDAGPAAPRLFNELAAQSVRPVAPGPRGRLRMRGWVHATGPSNSVSLRTEGKGALHRVFLPGAAVGAGLPGNGQRLRYSGDASAAAADPLVQALAAGQTITGARLGLPQVTSVELADAKRGIVALTLEAGTTHFDLGTVRVEDGVMMPIEVVGVEGSQDTRLHLIHLSSGDIIGGFSVRQA